jgi:deoxyribodipyrimidine photolyase-related protein
MSYFLIFPHQLFEKQYLINEKFKYILIEHPVFFSKYNFNKLKLILHRASMQYYMNYLKKNNYDIIYIEHNDYDKKIKKYKNEDIHIFDILDYDLEDEINKLFKNYTIYGSPNFLCSRKDLEEYSKLKNKKFLHRNFYFWQVERLGLDIKKSYDDMNRKKLGSSKDVPKLLKNSESENYIKDAIKYVKKEFPNNNLGSDELIFPITHKDTKKWFKHFLKNKLYKFGDYQDAIVEEGNFLYHSLIAPMMNIGLINPDNVLNETNIYYEKNKRKVKINNYEGFIRQVIGWREYQRMIYIYLYDDIINKNYFNHKRKLTKKWYDATTGIVPIDDAIKQGFHYGYLHHIQRLMVMSNFMNLCQIHPDEVFRWFMEFSCDSYDWVMVGNVYSMGLYADGGLTMTKPYISSDNYIMKMSNYKRGEWNEKWRSLYHGFLKRNNNKLKLRFPIKIDNEAANKAKDIIKNLTK